MISEDEQAKLRFELANANLQSISRAQGIYLTTLLTYICLVWATYLTGTGEAHVVGLELKMQAVWQVTPFITMVLILAVIGTLNASLVAWAEANDAGSALFGSRFRSLFEIDTHKNVIDYITLLQIHPRGPTQRPHEPHRKQQSFFTRLPHLTFPILFLIILLTSYWAVYQSWRGSCTFVAIGAICSAVQTVFSMRPMWRWIKRFSGASQDDDVYN